jgi:hypothetical protein
MAPLWIRWLLGILASLVCTVSVGCFAAAMDMRARFATLTEKVDNMGRSLERLASAVDRTEDGRGANATKLAELEARIRALEKYH